MPKQQRPSLDPGYLAQQRGADSDPYKVLVLAILERACADAAGHVVYPQGRNPWHLTVEARAWLDDGRELDTLLELAGYDAAALRERLRQPEQAEAARRVL